MVLPFWLWADKMFHISVRFREDVRKKCASAQSWSQQTDMHGILTVLDFFDMVFCKVKDWVVWFLGKNWALNFPCLRRAVQRRIFRNPQKIKKMKDETPIRKVFFLSLDEEKFLVKGKERRSVGHNSLIFYVVLVAANFEVSRWIRSAFWTV